MKKREIKQLIEMAPFLIVLVFVFIAITLARPSYKVKKAVAATIVNTVVPQEEETENEETGAFIPVNCELSTEYQEFLFTECEEKKVNYYLALAIIEQESNYDTNALSETEDYGLMQINSINHEYYESIYGEVDWLNPYDNMRVGTDILENLYDIFSGNTAKIITAYHLGVSGSLEVNPYEVDYTKSVLERMERLMTT